MKNSLGHPGSESNPAIENIEVDVGDLDCTSD